jgi:hypothetical protein
VGVYHRNELAYKQGLAAAKTADPPQPPFCDGATKDVPVVDFGAFNDKDGYNGWAPEAGFWRRLLEDENKRLAELRTRQMQIIGGEVLRLAHHGSSALNGTEHNSVLFRSAIFLALFRSVPLSTIFFRSVPLPKKKCSVLVPRNSSGIFARKDVLGVLLEVFIEKNLEFYPICMDKVKATYIEKFGANLTELCFLTVVTMRLATLDMFRGTMPLKCSISFRSVFDAHCSVPFLTLIVPFRFYTYANMKFDILNREYTYQPKYLILSLKYIY